MRKSESEMEKNWRYSQKRGLEGINKYESEESKTGHKEQMSREERDKCNVKVRSRQHKTRKRTMLT